MCRCFKNFRILKKNKINDNLFWKSDTKSGRWIQRAQIFHKWFVLRFMSCLFLWRFIDGIVNYFEWNCLGKLYLQMESHITWECIKWIQLIGKHESASSRVFNWSKCRVLHNEIRFFNTIFPLSHTRSIEFRIGLTPMRCHCRSGCCCCCRCHCAFIRSW